MRDQRGGDACAIGDEGKRLVVFIDMDDVNPRKRAIHIQSYPVYPGPCTAFSMTARKFNDAIKVFPMEETVGDENDGPVRVKVGNSIREALARAWKAARKHPTKTVFVFEDEMAVAKAAVDIDNAEKQIGQVKDDWMEWEAARASVEMRESELSEIEGSDMY
jgi:hypothetical protein